MTTQLGFQLRDAALVQSREGREDAIQQVREYLANRFKSGDTLSGDDVMDAVVALGLDHGDHRWVGNVLRGWEQVRTTVNFVPSRRDERHGAPLRQWVWR